MNMKNKTIYRVLIGLMLAGLIFAFCSDDYKDEDYAITDFDNRACNGFLTVDDDSTLADRPAYPARQATDMNQFVRDSLSWNSDFSIIDPGIYTMGFDSLFTSLYDSTRIEFAQAGDSVVNITLPSGDATVSYIGLNIAAAGEYVFFCDKFVDFSITDRDRNVVQLQSNGISMETAAECYRIKTRLVYNFSTAGHYLLKFTTESKQLRIFSLAQ